MIESAESKRAERRLSKPRFEPYPAACGGDEARALALHRWNIGFSQAIPGDIAVFEVALRSSYSEAMPSSFAGPEHWLLDPLSSVRKRIPRMSGDGLVDKNETNDRMIGEAVKKGGNPDDIVTALALGFWVHLANRSHHQDVWASRIHKARPRGTNGGAVHSRLDAASKLRDRIAHHEKLFCGRISGRLPSEIAGDCLGLLGELDPEVFRALSESDGIGFASRYAERSPCPADAPF